MSSLVAVEANFLFTGVGVMTRKIAVSAGFLLALVFKNDECFTES